MRHYLQSKKEKYISYPILYVLKLYQLRDNKLKEYVFLSHCLGKV